MSAFLYGVMIGAASCVLEGAAIASSRLASEDDRLYAGLLIGIGSAAALGFGLLLRAHLADLSTFPMGFGVVLLAAMFGFEHWRWRRRAKRGGS